MIKPAPRATAELTNAFQQDALQRTGLAEPRFGRGEVEIIRQRAVDELVERRVAKRGPPCRELRAGRRRLRQAAERGRRAGIVRPDRTGRERAGQDEEEGDTHQWTAMLAPPFDFGRSSSAGVTAMAATVSAQKQSA